LNVETRPGVQAQAPDAASRSEPGGQGGGGVQPTRPQVPLAVVFHISAKPALQWQEAHCVPSAFREKTRLALLTQGGGGAHSSSAGGSAL
jgi:hypothetical protein